MAQTRKKRKRRHRGTQAGTVEARGRTSRPSGATATTKKPANRVEAREQARARRAARFDEPPTWRSAFNRSVFAAALFGIAIIVLFKRPVVSGLALASLMVFLYMPMSYYTDRFLFNRRQKQKAAGRG